MSKNNLILDDKFDKILCNLISKKFDFIGFYILKNQNFNRALMFKYYLKKFL